MDRLIACVATSVLLGSITYVIGQGKSKTSLDGAQKPQTFKVRTELMEVRAVVLDRKGRVIENLKKEDFELLENGESKEISFFSVSKVETDRNQFKTAEPGSRDKTGIQATGAPEKDRQKELQDRSEQLRLPPVRTTLLFVDNLHLSFSSLNRVKQALRHFINERLTDQDAIAVATSSHTLGIAEQFTRDRQLLNYAIEKIRWAPGRVEGSFTPNVAAGVLANRVDDFRVAIDTLRREEGITDCCSLPILARARALQILKESSIYRKTAVSILKSLAEQMSRLPGKRMILVFSDGFTLYDSDSGIHMDQLQPAVDSAARSGIAIYTIHAPGLQIPPTIDASKNMAPSGSMFCGSKPDPRCEPPDLGLLAGALGADEQEMKNGLYAIAQQTGGKMYENQNNLDIPIRQAFDANRYYYVLSYYLKTGSDDRRFRSLKVRVRNHPEYTVRTARGFITPDKNGKQEDEAGLTPQQRLIRAVNAPLPLTEINVSARADFLESETDDKNVTLTVDFEGDRFQYREQDQLTTIDMEILYLIYDASAKQVEGASAMVQGKLTPERLAQAKRNGYRFSRRLALEPGVYQARVGVREIGSDGIGTAAAWIEVPELVKDKLEISSLTLRNPDDLDQPDTETIDGGELKQIRMVQGIPVYGRETFCEYSFRVRQGQQASGDSGLVFMRELLKGGSPVKQEPWLPIFKGEMIVDRNGWFEVNDDMDLRGLDPGVYELRVTVKDTGSNQTVRRIGVFSVE